MLKDYQLRQMYQLLTENSVEGKRSTSITGVPLGKNKRSVDKRKVCLFVFFKSYNFFLIQTISNKCCKKIFSRHWKFSGLLHKIIFMQLMKNILRSTYKMPTLIGKIRKSAT